MECVNSDESEPADASDSEMIRKCELQLNNILERRMYNISEVEHRTPGSIILAPEVRVDKRKEREEDENNEDGFVTVNRRKPKRLLRSDSIDQQPKSQEEIKAIYEVCITSTKELPKQMSMAKLLRSEQIKNIERIKYKSPFKVLIRFESDCDAEKLINCQQFQDLGYKCQKTFETMMSFGIIRGVDLEFSEKDILEVLKSDINILAVRRLKRLDMEGKWIESETVRVCFQGNTLPLYVSAYEYKFKVERYIFPVTQCSGCWKFGHVIKVCPKKKMLCPKCGSEEHTNCEIKTYKCLNCKGLHFVLDKSCPMYRKEKEIRDMMSKENIPYRKALQTVIDERRIKKHPAGTAKEIDNSKESSDKSIQGDTTGRRTYSHVVANVEVHRQLSVKPNIDEDQSSERDEKKQKRKKSRKTKIVKNKIIVVWNTKNQKKNYKKI